MKNSILNFNKTEYTCAPASGDIKVYISFTLVFFSFEISLQLLLESVKVRLNTYFIIILSFFNHPALILTAPFYLFFCEYSTDHFIEPYHFVIYMRVQYLFQSN